MTEEEIKKAIKDGQTVIFSNKLYEDTWHIVTESHKICTWANDYVIKTW